MFCLNQSHIQILLQYYLTPYRNWYHNFNPHDGPSLDSHVITHFKACTITYEELTIPPNWELHLEQKVMPSIYLAYTIEIHPSDLMILHIKWLLLLTPYKSLQYSHKPHYNEESTPWAPIGFIFLEVYVWVNNGSIHS